VSELKRYNERLKADAAERQTELDKIKDRIAALDSYYRSDNLVITGLSFATSSEAAAVPQDHSCLPAAASNQTTEKAVLYTFVILFALKLI